MSITTVAELVRTARNGRNQKDFARELGVKQSSVSRYECGKSSPPLDVIEHCMRLVHTAATDHAPTADELAERIRIRLAGAELGHVRIALARLIDALVNEHPQTRVLGPARQ